MRQHETLASLSSPRSRAGANIWVEVVCLETLSRNMGESGSETGNGKRKSNAILSRKILLWATRIWSLWETWGTSVEYRAQEWESSLWLALPRTIITALRSGLDAGCMLSCAKESLGPSDTGSQKLEIGVSCPERLSVRGACMRHWPYLLQWYITGNDSNLVK